jgi:hypothetical protein
VADRDELIQDYRQFTREMQLRFERAMREMRAERHEWRADLAAHRQESRQYFESIWAEIREHRKRTDEIIEENRAQRQALFAILDELRGNGGPAPAT